MTSRAVAIPLAGASLGADLTLLEAGGPVVVFAHGSGSSRHSPRNRRVAGWLQGAGLGTLLFDLLTEDEEVVDARDAHLRFDIDLLAGRLVAATDWLQDQQPGAIGYFGASTGAAAALVAAARLGDRVGAVVSRGGRPDLAGDALAAVAAPTLLIVGGQDPTVLNLNQTVMARLGGETRLEVVPGATHLFEEPGTLEQVGDLAIGWFTAHLRS